MLKDIVSDNRDAISTEMVEAFSWVASVWFSIEVVEAFSRVAPVGYESKYSC